MKTIKEVANLLFENVKRESLADCHINSMEDISLQTPFPYNSKEFNEVVKILNSNPLIKIMITENRTFAKYLGAY